MIPLRQPGKPAHTAYLQPPLAGDRVRYVGQPVAVVVATDRVAAADARELVEIEYDVLPARIDIDEAGPLLFPEGNVADSWTTTLGDVGGGFGARGEFYPEDFLIPYLARRLERPVKWVEDRREHFLAINHSREQQWSVVAAADERGRLLALDATLINVMGGYLRTHGVWAAALTASYLPGPYQWPTYRCRVSCAMTSKTPTGTVRAPG